MTNYVSLFFPYGINLRIKIVAPMRFIMSILNFLQGLPCTYLRVPNHLICEGFNDADFTARGRADGSHDSATDGSKLFIK